MANAFGYPFKRTVNFTGAYSPRGRNSLTILEDQLFEVVGPPSNSLSANNIVAGSPVVGTTTLNQTHALASTSLTSGNPVVQQATLGGGTVALVANNLTAGSSVVGQSALNQRHVLTATALTAGAPVVQASTLNQRHILNSLGLTSGSPVTQASTLASVQSLSASNLVSGASVVQPSTLGQRHVITSVSLVSGSPVAQATTVAQNHVFTPVELTSGSPVVAATEITITVPNNSLEASNITSENPVLNTPTAFDFTQGFFRVEGSIQVFAEFRGIVVAPLPLTNKSLEVPQETRDTIFNKSQESTVVYVDSESRIVRVL
jgi:hypothetical protein